MKNNKCTLLCAIMLILISGLTGVSTVFAQSWTSIDGGGTSGINTAAAATSIVPSVAVYNGSLYAIWCEMVSSKGQIHIKKYNGSTWDDAGSSGSQLDISTTGAENPKLASYNGYLYAAWQEYDNGIYNIHVKQYNGSTWTFTQSYTVGDGRININHGTTANSQSVDILVFNNELYATWVEQSPLWQLRVAKFDGSYWSNIDGNGMYGLNYNTGYDAYLPRLGAYNNSLYLTWTETNSSGVKQLRVKRYDGSSVWTLIGGGANGLNYDVAQSPEAPILVSYNSYLYLFWDEYDNITALKYKVRVKRYDGSSWATDPDGGYGWHYNPAKTTVQPSAYANNNLLYVSWEENKSPYQIRIVSFDGTTKTFIDGNGVSGINQDIAMRAHNPELIIKTGDLYAVWNEDNGGSDNAQQIRAKKYLLAPVIESVSVPANGTYITGQTLSFTVNYSKDVVVSGGTPYIPITLNTGGTVNATYTGGSGTSTLTFSYSIVAGNGDADGISVGTAISTGGATLQSEDATPLTANLTLNSVGSTTGVLVDAAGPTVTSVSSTNANGYYNTGDVITITITCSEAATVTNTPTLSLNSGGTASYTSGSGTTVLTFSYTIAGGHNSNDLDYSSISALSLSGGTIKDGSGNDATLTLPTVGGPNSLGGQKDIVIDNTAPTVTLSSTATDPTNAAIPVTITFSESVSGFVVGDISVTNGTAGSFTAVNAYTYTASITPTAAGTVTVNVAGSVATDAASNSNTAASALTRVFDNVAPTVALSSTATDPTNAAIPVTITFSESVSGFVVGDISVTNGTAGSFTAVNAYTYTASITPTAAGTVTVSVTGSVATDAASNSNTAASALTRVFDNVAPTVALSSTATDPTNAAIPVTITFSESVTGFAVGDITVTNGTAGSFTTVNAYTYTASITPTAAGTVTVNVAGSVATDAAGNSNTAASALTRVFDNVAPTVALSSTATDPTNAAIPVTIMFSESVTGFAVGDITVTNGTAGSFTTVNAYTYTASITPTAAGTVTVSVAGSVATDAAGNSNTAASALTRVFDNVAPTVALSSTATDPTNAAIPVTITFSESVTGFAIGDITVTNGTAGSFTTVNAYTYTASITPTAAGTVTVNVAGSVATDAAGNNNTAATALTRVYDNVAPTVALSSTAPDPTNAAIPVTITFSESVSGFVVGDITVTNGTAGSFTTVNAYTYTASITPTAAGTVTVNVAGSVATDAASNSNTAASALTRVFDNVAPTVALSSTATDPTNAVIPVTITFSESVSGFVVGDISVTNGTAGSFTAVNAYTYTASITPTAAGTVTVSVAGSVATDAAGNSNTAATVLTRVYDNVAPTVAITSSAGDPTNISPIPVTITFSESVSGFVVGDISVTNGTPSGFSGGGLTYTVNVTPSGQGTVVVNVAAEVASDAAGNGNAVATQLSRIYDGIAPSITVSSTTPDPTNANPISINIVFSEEVTGFNVSDITVGNATASNLQTSDNISWTADISPSHMGAFSVEIYAGVAQDLAGNGNTASAYFQRTYDPVAPTVILSSTSPDPTNYNPIVINITLSESSWNLLDLTDIIVGNGTASNLQLLATGYHENWTVDIYPTADGLVTVDIAAGVVQDFAGNDNIAAAQFSRICDITAPTVVLSSTSANPTNASLIPVTITFNEPVTGFVVGDIIVTNGTVGNFSGSGAAYTVDVTPSGEGPVTVSVGAGVAQDVVGNGNTASTQLSRTYIFPAINFTEASQSSVGESGTMTITAQLSAASISDVTVPFTVNNSSTATEGGIDYSIMASPITIVKGNTTGTITITIVADALDENNETVIVDMGTPTNATQGVTTTHTATITDDDETPVVTVSQSFNIDENSFVGTVVGTVVATDPDAGALFTNWTITSNVNPNNNGIDAFAINSTTGQITVLDVDDFDRETNSSFTLKVSVSDGTNTSAEETVTTSINDVNDVTPVITASQELHVTEQSPNGTTVGTILATDGDVAATTFQDWTITAGNSNGYFAINASTGVITVIDNTGLNPNVNPSFTLTLTVSDGTNTSQTQTVSIIVASINDDNPVITASQSFSIDENSANTTVIGTVLATDPDYGTVFQNWSIITGNTNNAFTINPNNGEISVNTSSALDYESVTSFSLTVQVSDGAHTGSGVVTVNLNNLNDSSPVVTDATFAVDENSANGAAVGAVVATDADGILNNLTYSISSGNTNNAFTINPNNGEISVNTSSALDYESITSFSLTVQVSDGAHTGSGVVTVNLNNLNDSSPVVTDATFAVDENSANGAAVGAVVAADADGSLNSLTYSIASGNTNDAFAMNSSGEITVNTSSALDYESVTSFSLTVQVSDGAHTGSGVVTVNLSNLNDSSPVVTDATFAVDENSANGAAVGAVVAADADGILNNLTYSISSGNTNNAFAINSSGEITVNTSSALDYESVTSFSLTVQVSDGAHTGSGVVTVNLSNLNDSSPVVTDATFAVDENSANGTAVGAVVATDADGILNNLTYFISSGNTNDAFAINLTSGALTVNNVQALDFETTPVFNLTVTASDGTHSGSANIKINLNDVVETGIDDELELSIIVYPNPAVNEVNVSSGNTSISNYIIEIYNINGARVYQSEPVNSSKAKNIDLTGFSKGIYFIKVFNKQNSYTKKFIIE